VSDVGASDRRRQAIVKYHCGSIDILLSTKMSTKQTHQGEKNPSTVKPNRIHVEQHAELRFLQRVDATAQNPSEQIRGMFRRGHPYPSADVASGRCRRHGEYLIVYRGSEDRPEVITILRAGDRR
jgi:hypothetical protein